MAKTKKEKINLARLSHLLNVVFLVALVVAGFLVYEAINANEVTIKTARPKVDVSLGAMQYTFTDGKAIKRDDPSVNNLRKFLDKTAEKDGFLGCSSAIYHVARYNKAETQVLLNFGCDNSGARMFAVKDETGWRLLSPTDQFDDLGVPRCEHVDENKISPEIAPVCMKGWGGPVELHEYIGRQ